MGVAMGRKLWLFAGGAVAVWIAIGLLGSFVPSVQRELPLALISVLGIWAALSLLVLLIDARRKRRLVVSIALALALTLSLFTHWFGAVAYFLGYFGAVLFIGTALVLAALRLFRKKSGPRALVFPLTMILMGACGLLVSPWSSKPGPPIPEQTMSISDEIKYIHDTDQSDRYTGYWLVDMGRDRIRLQRVKTLYRAGQITDPMDQYRAALVYQHGSCTDEFQIAYELATAAEAGHGVPNAHPPLSHLAYDRWQLSLGKQQKYGTQLLPVPIKRPCPPAP
jgi:hypothetical protein